jgi:hypothetical protein
VHEVPCSQAPLFAFDNQQRLARDEEEILLIGLPVVHRHRVAGAEHDRAHAELFEPGLPLELGVRTATFAVPPWGLARVDDEPTFAVCGEAVIGLLERRFGNDVSNRRPRRSSLRAA